MWAETLAGVAGTRDFMVVDVTFEDMTVLTLAGKTGALVALGALCVAGGGAILNALKSERQADE